VSSITSTSQQRFAREFDAERFRVQVNWLIEHRRVWKNGKWARRTNKSIVQQIKAQHPGFDISETHFSNLVTGKKPVIVTLQLALYIGQVFGIEDLDFFLDPDVEHQRQQVLEPIDQAHQVEDLYVEVLQRNESDAGVLAALRGVPPQDLAALRQLIALHAQPDEIHLIEVLRRLPEAQRAVFEQVIRGLAGGASNDPGPPQTK
jgi:hypothetical protein